MNYDELSDRSKQLIAASQKQYEPCPSCEKVMPPKASRCPHCRKIIRFPLWATVFIAVLAPVACMPFLIIFNETCAGFWSWVWTGSFRPRMQIATGQFSSLPNYPKGAVISVQKRDGSFERAPNDLETLCKNYVVYRSKISRAENTGDTQEAARFRQKIREVESALDEYNESDVNTMLAVLDRDGYHAP